MHRKYIITNENVAYTHCYWFKKEPMPIPEADAATFEQIGDWFARDKNNVYFLYNVVAGADPATFCVLGGYAGNHWAKDRLRAYHFEPSKAARNIRFIESKSLDLFAVLLDSRFDEYAADAERVYRNGRLIRGAHAATFRVLANACKGEDQGLPSFDFARDKARIYFMGKPIADVRLETFDAIRLPGIGHNEYGTDGVSAFFEDQWNGKIVRIAFAELPEAVRAAYLDRS
jgi:DKNYY family